MFQTESPIGYIQGRLSPRMYNRIQCFPVNYWREELYFGSKNGFSIVEWTVDSPTLTRNPILDIEGLQEIRLVCENLNVSIPSITCDFFMENPPWEDSVLDQSEIAKVFLSLFRSTDVLGKLILVVPLVDNSSIKNVLHFEQTLDLLQECGVDKYPIQIAFESDFPPIQLFALLIDLPKGQFGINLDIGNSAALGFDPEEEVRVCGEKIINVHLKDRLFKGHSVHFGTGDTDFSSYLRELYKIDYSGNYILQSQRSLSNHHLDELRHSKRHVENYLSVR